VAQLAAANYMNSGLDPTFQALTTGDAQQFLSQASAIAELNQSSGVKVSTLSNQVSQALRDKQTADQQIAAVNALEAQMNAKKKVINAKIDKVNSAAMKQAMAVFEQTGHYPNISIPTANTVGAQALQAALTKAGDPYIWGAAGPSEFDCSGLVVWAYAQEGIALPHYTGSLWNSGMHVARSDLEPGDLVFFFPDISHVGIYMGNGMMIDASTFGVPVHVEPIYWSAYVGARPDRLSWAALLRAALSRPARIARAITEGHLKPGLRLGRVPFVDEPTVSAPVDRLDMHRHAEGRGIDHHSVAHVDTTWLMSGKKKTRSPGSRSLRATCIPEFHRLPVCSAAARCLPARTPTRPGRSSRNSLGPAAPQI